MPEKKEPEFVAARYIGGHIIDLSQTGRKCFNIDGSLRTEPVTNGDTLMMPASEVLGQTFLNLKNGKQLYLGAGRLVLKEDEGKAEDDLKAMGYQWDMPRADFEVIEVKPASQSKQSKVLATSLEIDPSQVIKEEVK